MENFKVQKHSEVLTMKGDWKEQSLQLKDQYSQLTDEDLEFEVGKEDDLLRRVENRLNKNREEVLHIIRKVQPSTL